MPRLFSRATLFAALASTACSAPPPRPPTLPPSLPPSVAPSASHSTPCASLTALALPGVTVSSATLDGSGVVTSSLGRTPVPPFCRVQAIARPTADSEIHIELWLPAEASWNGKLAGTGNSGFKGDLSYGAMAKALASGFATGGHDTGHTGEDLRFGFGHPEKVVDYGYRAVHLMTTTLKAVARAHYGRAESHAYFTSCSAGGQQALSEVQRYPDDYDGVVAGAPSNNRVAQTFGLLWSWLALHDAKGAPLVTPAQLHKVTEATLEACDAIDGLADGLIDDPRRCTFDPAALACAKGVSSPDCLGAQQVEAIRKVHAGLKSPRTGEPIFAGYPKGGEALQADGVPGWLRYLLGPKEPARVGILRYFVFRDPSWDYHSVDWDRDYATARREASALDATETNLAPFASRGGKLILQSGWADAVIPPEDTIAYYDAVTTAMGGADKTRAFARLFMTPGSPHCGLGGTGPDNIDALAAIDQWVTTGNAPERVIAVTNPTDPSDPPRAPRSRPLCPYPQVARYRGAGSIDDAASFVCQAPERGASAVISGTQK